MMILKQQREEKGYTQAQIAEKAGLSVRGYRKIESGKAKPSCDVVIFFQREFGLPIDILLSKVPNTEL